MADEGYRNKWAFSEPMTQLTRALLRKSGLMNYASAAEEESVYHSFHATLAQKILTVSKEFHVLMNMVLALSRVERGPTTIDLDLALKGKLRLELASISFCRFTFIFCLVVLRAIIAVGLLIAGLKYLSFEPSLR